VNLGGFDFYGMSGCGFFGHIIMKLFRTNLPIQVELVASVN